jgi:hypothetical protein
MGGGTGPMSALKYGLARYKSTPCKEKLLDLETVVSKSKEV